jgi:hypothetical protein
MATPGPSEGSSNTENLKDLIKNPFSGLKEKFRDTKLYDIKVGLIHKKYVFLNPAIMVPLLTASPTRNWEVCKLGQTCHLADSIANLTIL